MSFDLKGGEIASQKEEERHANKVEQPDHLIDDGRVLAVSRREDRVRERAVGQGCVKENAGEHGHGPQVVEVMVAFVRLHGEVFLMSRRRAA
jgi:hypothetical protein